MAGDLVDAGASFSSLEGLVFVFNLIVGTGALTMPRAFAEAGWLVSLFVVCALCFMSYMTVTFVVESMAAANAVRKYAVDATPNEKVDLDGKEETKSEKQVPSGVSASTDPPQEDERTPLLVAVRAPQRARINEDTREYYEITDRIEMGKMASMFFNKWGMYLFYLCIIIYLYGDLAIYAAAVPKSMRDVACTYVQSGANTTCNTTLTDTDPCWPGVPSVNRADAYRIFLAAFLLLLGPFIFFDVQKTKYLQHFTSFMRWFAFITMVVLAVIRLAKGEGTGRPPVADISGVPTLFGVCVYSFMCHHSLPSLTTPIRDKSKLSRLFAADYLLILAFYCLLSLTGVFSFRSIQDLYTLNFQPHAGCGDPGPPVTTVLFLQYFLALFPVFTLSTNFPIIGITLRNNLQALCLQEDRARPYSLPVRRLLFPLLTLIPPAAVAFATDQVSFLVGITGSYAGAGIQYFVPAALVLCARRELSGTVGSPRENPHLSPFRHSLWVVFTLVWGTVCVVFVTVNHIITRQ